MAPQITVVSPERIAMELRLMLTQERRGMAVRLLDELGLIATLLPELGRVSQNTLATLDKLPPPSIALALAALFAESLTPEQAADICRRWRMSNRDSERRVWLLKQRQALTGARQQAWSRLQRVLMSPGAAELIDLHAANDWANDDDLQFCRDWLARSRPELDPPPLLTGDDLLRHGIPAGKHFQGLLDQIRDAQLDGKISSRQQALALADQLWPPT